jgi:hypothetical protein
MGSAQGFMIFMSADWPKAPRRQLRPWTHCVVGEHKVIAESTPARNTRNIP